MKHPNKYPYFSLNFRGRYHPPATGLISMNKLVGTRVPVLIARGGKREGNQSLREVSLTHEAMLARSARVQLTRRGHSGSFYWPVDVQLIFVS